MSRNDPSPEKPRGPAPAAGPTAAASHLTLSRPRAPGSRPRGPASPLHYLVASVCVHRRRPRRQDLLPMLPGWPGPRSGRVASPPLEGTPERDNRGCADERRRMADRSSLRRSPQQGTTRRSEPLAKHRGRGALKGPGPDGSPPEGRVTTGASATSACVAIRELSGALGRRLPRGCRGALTSPREAGLWGRGRALPAGAGSPDCGSIRDGRRAGQPGQEVRAGICPAPQARPVAAARSWAPGGARRRGPGLAPPAQPWSRPAGAAARQGAGPAAGRPERLGASGLGRVTSAGAPAAATGAGPPRDRLQSRCA